MFQFLIGGIVTEKKEGYIKIKCNKTYEIIYLKPSLLNTININELMVIKGEKVKNKFIGKELTHIMDEELRERVINNELF